MSAPSLADCTANPGVSRQEKWIFLIFAPLLLISMVAWQCIDTRPPRWDESTYLRISTHSYQKLQEGSIRQALVLKDITHTKPGGIPFLSALSYFIVGDSPRVAAFLVNTVSIIAILSSLLRCGQLFWAIPGIGLLAFSLFLSNPIVCTWLGYYQVDLPLTALSLVTFTCCVWIRSDCNYPKSLKVLLLSTIAIGMATKHLYVAFVAAPLGLLFIEHWFISKIPLAERPRKQIKLWICIGSGVALGFLYHYANWHIVTEQLVRSRDVARTGATAPAQPIWPILRDFAIPSGFPIGIALLFLVLAALATWKKKRMNFIYLTSSAFIGTWAVSEVASFPISYYLLPVLPLFILAAVGGLAFPLQYLHSTRKFKLLPTAICVVVSTVSFAHGIETRLGTSNLIGLAEGLPHIIRERVHPTVNPVVRTDYWTGTYVDGNTSTLPYPHDWKVDQIFNSLSQLIPKTTNRIYRLASLTNYEWMSADLFSYEIHRRGLAPRLSFTLPLPSAVSLEVLLPDFEFIFLKTGQIWKKDFYSLGWANDGQRMVEELLEDDALMLNMLGFRLFKSFPLPDGSMAQLWASSDRVLNKSLIAELPLADIEALPGLISTSTFTIDGETRTVLYAHPPPPSNASSVSWSNLRIEPNSILEFGIALSPVHWSPDKGDGVHFEIEIDDGKSAVVIFRQYIDPKQQEEDRRWHDHKISLKQWQGQDVRITLKTRAANDSAFDHAGWSRLVISR